MIHNAESLFPMYLGGLVQAIMAKDGRVNEDDVQHCVDVASRLIQIVEDYYDDESTRN